MIWRLDEVEGVPERKRRVPPLSPGHLACIELALDFDGTPYFQR